ncbi:hypothetical protein QYE76_071585 [Lolium multiflorum]|uniref:Protein FAR1-RELATED SEQUENCE n=1 Tax=Lolium multiflorum TaxID=4521 RepID=A0AAD8WFJ3_LOLMU|nr:hypothetical protein QYE76_071585 [Lolium multiflorum]
MASGIDNEKATTDVDDSRWEAFDISSSEDEYEVPSSDDDDSIFGDPVSESDNVSFQLDHTKHEDDKDPYDIDAEMNRQQKYKAVRAMTFLSEEAAYYFYNKKIKTHQKSRIMSLGAAGMRLFNIMRTFISDTGKYSRVGFVRKDLYNMSCREKRKMIAKGDANTTIGIMEKRKRDDPEFYFDYKLGKGGKLLHMFWCDSQSRQDYADFGDVLVFDSTYKTNQYDMPFIPFVGTNNHC